MHNIFLNKCWCHFPLIINKLLFFVIYCHLLYFRLKQWVVIQYVMKKLKVNGNITIQFQREKKN